MHKLLHEFFDDLASHPRLLAGGVIGFSWRHCCIPRPDWAVSRESHSSEKVSRITCRITGRQRRAHRGAGTFDEGPQATTQGNRTSVTYYGGYTPLPSGHQVCHRAIYRAHQWLIGKLGRIFSPPPQ